MTLFLSIKLCWSDHHCFHLLTPSFKSSIRLTWVLKLTKRNFISKTYRGIQGFHTLPECHLSRNAYQENSLQNVASAVIVRNEVKEHANRSLCFDCLIGPIKGNIKHREKSEIDVITKSPNEEFSYELLFGFEYFSNPYYSTAHCFTRSVSHSGTSKTV